MRGSALRLLGLAALALSGCGSLLDYGPTNRCESDGDCVEGTCDPALAMCVSAPDVPLRVALEVVPASDPFGGTRSRVGFEPFELTDVRTQDLELPLGVRVTGMVRDAFGEPVTADVSFRRESVIPGRPSIVTTAQTAGDATLDDTGVYVNFAIQLLPETNYEITIQPNGDARGALPPITVGTIMTRAPGTSRHLDAELDVYPHPCSDGELTELTTATEPPLPTCMGWYEGMVIDADRQGIDGLTVRIVGSDGRVLSSTAETGTEGGPGHFRVAVPLESWLNPMGWSFEVAPTTHRREERGPEATFLVSPLSLYPENGQLTILAPTTQEVVVYEGSVEADDGLRFPPSTLAFTSRDIVNLSTGTTGSFVANASSNAGDGAFEVRLLPGTYDVLITPMDLEGEFGVLRQEVIIPPAADVVPGSERRISGQIFGLPRRAQLGGTVSTVAGDTVLNAEVLAVALGQDLDGTLGGAARYARSTSTFTDQAGQFNLRLDVGVYDLLVRPPDGANFPWKVARERAIGGAGLPLPATFTIPNPVPVSGRASFAGPDGPLLVAGGEVNAYALVGDRAVLIGRTTTASDGTFRLLLPPSI